MSANQSDDRFISIEGLPPGLGAVRLVESEAPLTGAAHFDAWGAAVDAALLNIKGAPGRYRKHFKLEGTVDVTNPGVIVEYSASIAGDV